MPTQVTDKLAYYYKNGQLYKVGGGDAGGVFMSFNIADATEETVDNIPGYTWDLTEEQFSTLCDPAMQSVTVDIVIPGEGEANQHYIFHRDAAASVGVLGSAFFFAVDTSQATTDVVGTAMRLRVYRNVTWLKLRIEVLGEIMTSDAVTAALEGKANASDVYTKSQTYTKTEEDTLLGAKADASGVYTKTQVDSALSGKVDKVSGKGLSANDFTDAYKDAVDADTAARHTHSNKAILDATTASYTTAEKTKLSGVEEGAQVNTVNKVNNKTGNVSITKKDLDLENVENKSTATIKSEFTGSVAEGNTGFVTGGAVKTYVDTAITNLPEPMIFKGTLGTGGTITSLPAAAAANEGFTYKVITAGTYASQAAKVGDVFISNGSAWALVPAGDDVEDTWREVKVNGTSLLGTGISTGAVNFKSGTNVTVSGSGNDITISASQPAVNNGTLTIQKNGTNVQTFTANQSNDVTANITVPVNLSDIGNRNQAYIAWGGPNLVGDVSPLEVASIDDLGHNKFAFMSAASVTIQYSRDAGSTWVDYGADSAAKRNLVTLSYPLHIGNRTSSNTVNDRLRIILNANIAGGNVYCNLRRMLIYLSTEGSGGCQVIVEHRTIGNYLSGSDTWNTVGTYGVSGWSGWNSIPFSGPFGGSSSQTGQTAQIRLTFSVASVMASYSNLTIYSIRGIAFPLWQSPSTMASTGHLYSYDIDQNASFPAGVSASSFTENGTTLSNKYQAKDADLTAIAGLSDGSTGFLKKTAANTWTLTTPADSNQTVKGNGTAFGANDAVNFVGAGTVSVAADTTNKKITVTGPTAVSELTNDRFVRYDTASQGLSATQKSNAKTNLELNNVVNTGDSATPASGGTQKFTTGGAYAMKEELKASIKNIDDVLFAGSIDTDDYELADFIKWVHLQENPIDGAIYTMYDSNHEFCVWKGISLDGGRTVVALHTTMTSGGGEGTPILHLVSVISIDETTGECTFDDDEMASVASVRAVDAKASKVVIGGTQYTASFSGGVLSFNR